MKLIIFRKKNLEKGILTIDKIKKKLKSFGHKVVVICLEDLEFFIEKGKVKVMKGKTSLSFGDGAYFRVIGKNRSTAFMIANLCERKNVKFIDHYHFKSEDQEKLTQMFLFALNGLPIPKTYFSGEYDGNKINNLIEYLGLPVVAKITNVNGGKGVFLLLSKKDIVKFAKENSKTEIIFQEFINNNFDYRILVLDNAVKIAEKKTRSKDSKDFRNNVALGAKEEFLDIKCLDKNIKQLSIDSSKIMNFQISGVDVITDKKDNHYILEVNCAPQFTLDEKISSEITEVVTFLNKWLKKRK